MNIFAVDLNTSTCARYHIDKHIVKMPVELAQMISFVYYDYDYWQKENPSILMAFSKNHALHPCSKWIKESLGNFIWTSELGIKLIEEYRYRYNSEKHERCYQIFKYALNNYPDFDKWEMTDFALAMPDEYKCESSIESYRTYYRLGKLDLLKWTKRDIPEWIN